MQLKVQLFRMHTLTFSISNTLRSIKWEEMEKKKILLEIRTFSIHCEASSASNEKEINKNKDCKQTTNREFFADKEQLIFRISESIK